MLYLLGKAYFHTFLRLFSSHIVLLSIGILTTWILTWIVLPRLWHRLPHDHGKALVPGGELSKGKPTGAGRWLLLLLLPAFILFLPPEGADGQGSFCSFAGRIAGKERRFQPGKKRKQDGARENDPRSGAVFKEVQRPREDEPDQVSGPPLFFHRFISPVRP